MAKTDEADEANGADEADSTSKAANATKANKAKATDEADQAKADEANEAKANQAREAIIADDTDEANNVIVAVEADAAIDTNKADEADLTSKAVEANEAKDAIMADKADELNVLNEADKAGIANEADVAKLLLPFSLTKCFAFFSEDKGYFGIRLMARSQDELDKLIEAKGANNNQLWGGSLSSLITWNQDWLDNQLKVIVKSDWDSLCSHWFRIPNNMHEGFPWSLHSFKCWITVGVNNQLVETTNIEMGCSSLSKVVHGVQVRIWFDSVETWNGFWK